MARYFVAVRHGSRSDGEEIEARLRRLPGVTVEASTNPHRVVIRSTPKVANDIKRRFGEMLIVERDIRHRALAGVNMP